MRSLSLIGFQEAKPLLFIFRLSMGLYPHQSDIYGTPNVEPISLLFYQAIFQQSGEVCELNQPA